MNKSNNDLKPNLNNSVQESTILLIDKQEDSPPRHLRRVTGEEWARDAEENCRRMYQDEDYRKEVAKRQF